MLTTVSYIFKSTKRNGGQESRYRKDRGIGKNYVENILVLCVCLLYVHRVLLGTFVVGLVSGCLGTVVDSSGRTRGKVGDRGERKVFYG